MWVVILFHMEKHTNGNGYLPDVMKSSIFSDKKMLDIEWVPPKDMLIHIEDKITSFAYFMSSLCKGERPPNCIIYGPVGTGKTLIVRVIMDELKSFQEKHNFKVVYIKCGECPTAFKVLSQINIQANLGCCGTRTNVYYDKIREYIKDNKMVVILDEIDRLDNGNDIVFSLSRTDNVSIVGISNEVTFIDEYDTRTKSSLGARNIVMDYYNAMQIGDILRKREGAFKEGVLTHAIIPKCAALAAQEHGDARKAISLLRAAGEAAEKAGDGVVKEHHLDEAEQIMDVDVITTTLMKSPAQMKLLFYSIIEVTDPDPKKPVQTATVYERYIQLCRECGKNELTQRRVNDLISELDLRGLISRKVISRGRHGKASEIIMSTEGQARTKIKDILKGCLG